MAKKFQEGGETNIEEIVVGGVRGGGPNFL